LIGTSTTDPSGQTTFVGVAVITGLGLGGGPMPGGPGQPPLSIWGPTDPRPGNPISGIPGLPGGPGQQPGIWGPNDPRPGNPISGIPGLPGAPGQQPPPPGGGGGSPGSWRWVYSPFYGWVLDPGTGGKPQPPGGAGSQPGEPPHPDRELPEPEPQEPQA
jgi:hypothetical protein